MSVPLLCQCLPRFCCFAAALLLLLCCHCCCHSCWTLQVLPRLSHLFRLLSVCVCLCVCECFQRQSAKVWFKGLTAITIMLLTDPQWKKAIAYGKVRYKHRLSTTSTTNFTELIKTTSQASRREERGGGECFFLDPTRNEEEGLTLNGEGVIMWGFTSHHKWRLYPKNPQPRLHVHSLDRRSY